ncbi:hypothetical protein [Burkholderia lata]|uniref:hypothetical protein n=1 Tax=Burkholderia lata (strain ATCC 17760 / DSM 23089 / LMG 22485 / NCIMB 9086 / R18194 / 383) TaxID=482957 RepID=UPI001582BB46|nr:hypothetical protein [Burkholderia lata]
MPAEMVECPFRQTNPIRLRKAVSAYRELRWKSLSGLVSIVIQSHPLQILCSSMVDRSLKRRTLASQWQY